MLQRVLITKLYAGMKIPNFEPLFVSTFCANLNVQRCKIETFGETEYFQPINEEVISYRITKVKKCKNNTFKKLYHYTTKYAVLEFAVENTENLKEIDTSLICDNFIMDDE